MDAVSGWWEGCQSKPLLGIPLSVHTVSESAGRAHLFSNIIAFPHWVINHMWSGIFPTLFTAIFPMTRTVLDTYGELHKYLLNEWALLREHQCVTAHTYEVHRPGCGEEGTWLGAREAAKSREEREQAEPETWEGAGMENGAAGQADSCPCLIGHRQLRSPRWSLH